MKQVTRLCLTMLFFTGFTLLAKEDHSDKTIYISNIAPWMIGDDSACRKGLICDYFNALFKNSGIKEQYKYESLPRANERFYNGEQFVALFPYNKDFTPKYHLIGEVLHYDVGILSNKSENSFAPKDDEICITRNNPHKVTGYRYNEVNTYGQCLGMLNKGRVKFVLITNVEFEFHYAKPLEQSQYEFAKLYSIPLWLYLNKGYSENSPTYLKLVERFESLKKR